MTERDTLRWGDAIRIDRIEALSVENPQVFGKQVFQAHWRWPLTWTMQVALVPEFDTTETASFTVRVLVTVGCGQGMIEYPYTYVLAPVPPGTAPTIYLPVQDQKFIPGQDIQARVSVSGVAALTNASGRDSLNVGLFVAPMTEPHAPTFLYDKVAEGQDRPATEWMPAGFTPETLGYGPHGRR